MLRKLRIVAVLFALAVFSNAAVDSSPDALREAGHWKRLRQVMEARAANPRDASAAYYLSCVKTAMGETDSAMELAQRAVTLEPGNSQYHLQLGVLFGRKAQQASMFKAMGLAGRYKDEMKKAVELDPKNIEAIWELMEFYWHAPGIAGGDQKKARTLAGGIMRLNAAKGNLALAELADKQEADIEDYYHKAEQADGKSYEVQMRLARFYASDKQKKYDLAEKHARQAITIDGGRIGGYKVLAAIRAQQERWRELESLLGEAESHVPDDLSPNFHAGLEILLAGKDPARAERYFRKYLMQEPEGYSPRLSRAHWRLGQALEKQGRKAEAIAEMESALRLEPDLDEAKKDLKALKR